MFHSRTRFWIESASCVGAAVISLTTLLWPDWFELLTRVEPDGGNGSLEIVVATVSAVLAVLLGLSAYRERRRKAAEAM